MDERPHRGQSLVGAYLFIEGAEAAKGARSRCREAFQTLFRNAGVTRTPRFVPCGGRGRTFDKFKTAHKSCSGFVAMLIDSEDPVVDAEKTWAHLKSRDGWDHPVGATDEQVLLMTTSMETRIAFDRAALKQFFGSGLQENALPPLFEIEKRDRHDVLKKLEQATRDCKPPYRKGDVSFRILATLDPVVLNQLPSFARTIRILKAKL